MSPHDDTIRAIATLEVKLQHLIVAGEQRDIIMQKMAAQLSNVEDKFKQAEGGLLLLRVLGVSSVAGGVAVAAALYHWVRPA